MGLEPEGPVSEESQPGNASVPTRGTSFTCRCSWTHGLGLVLAPLRVLEGVFGNLQRTTRQEVLSEGGRVLVDSILCGTAVETSSQRVRGLAQGYAGSGPLGGLGYLVLKSR